LRLATPRELGRRSSVVVLVVIAVAVVMLGVLLVETSRQTNDTPLAVAAERQRQMSEQIVASALALRAAPPDQRELRRRAMRSVVARWRDAGARLRGADPTGAALPAGSPLARAVAAAAIIRYELAAAADTVSSLAEHPHADDALLIAQRRYAATMDRLVQELELASSVRVAWLVEAEGLCVVLLLGALGIGVRLALRPTHERLMQTVEALAESESRSRAVLDAMQEGLVLFDADGRMVRWNASALRILRLGEHGSDTAMRALAPEMIDEHGVPLGDRLPSRVTLRTGRPLTDVIVGLPGDDGEARWLSVNTHPLRRSEDARPHAAVSVFRDVTADRRLADERAAQAEALELQNRELLEQADLLERGQALFRSVVETAGSAIIGLDTAGVVFEWNREAEALFGVPRAYAIGRSYVEAFAAPEHRTAMRDGITAVLAGTPLRNFAGPVKSPTGDRRTVLWNLTPLHDVSRSGVQGLIAAGLDITEREASEERFRLLFERSSDAHLLYDERGIIDCNEAARQLLRYPTREEVLALDPNDLSPHRQPDGRLSLVVAAQMRQRARVQGFHRYEWVHQRADGADLLVETTLTPVRLHGREVILAVWHDIAERKAVEAALRTAKNAAESANRTKSDFMARMNHELRTPLTAIIGFSRVLLQGKEGALSPGAARYADRIRANGMHLLTLINQILDLAKVEAGRMELDVERVAVDALVRDTLSMLDAMAEAKGLTLLRELPARVEPIQTDAGKLRQILINLVGNAIKFTNEGEVSVRVEVDASGGPLTIAVSDTGVGIAPERHARVFDPFEQGDSSSRRRFGGTGLGLSIVKSFADLIGARITLESEVGRGTTFTLWLARPEATIAPVAVRSEPGVARSA
jgi:PAS domain S-box-containing protein